MGKKTNTIILCVALSAVLILTLLPPYQTWALSEFVRNIFVSLGLKPDALQFRSDAHLIEYFGVGVAVALFGRSAGWKPWLIVTVGCAVGVVDETLKVFLPTREFGIEDLIKDFLGIGIAVCIVFTVDMIRQQKTRNK